MLARNENTNISFAVMFIEAETAATASKNSEIRLAYERI